ncbi:Gdt1 family [Trypanosoma melophagium]|uniref:Gdt1 family n=1 Tax=Trypanosoma melophagium TaxID=715481 RepID=UPI003519EAA6|nr:Gdt1 family [Trypanosoma melophagium]
MSTVTEKSWMEGMLSSLSMIIFSEIGDKTFFIACLMAMRHSKAIVFLGAIGALATMTVLSALMGVMVPNVLSVRVTEALAVVLFLFFGCNILYGELYRRNVEVESEDEMAEAAAVLRRRDPNDHLETGSNTATSSNANININTGGRRFRWRGWRTLLHPVLVEAFTLTFVAEWGDRSQLATIALAAAKNPYAVTLGGVLGHAICAGVAVLFGNLIAQYASMRTVNIFGGVLFILFAIGTLYEFITQTHHIDEAERHKTM